MKINNIEKANKIVSQIKALKVLENTNLVEVRVWDANARAYLSPYEIEEKTGVRRNEFKEAVNVEEIGKVTEKFFKEKIQELTKELDKL